MNSLIWKIPLDEFKQAIKESLSWADVAKRYYNKSHTNLTLIKRRVQKEQIDTSHFLGKSKYKNRKCPHNSHLQYSIDELLVNNPSHRIPNQRLKAKLLHDNWLVNQCYTCGILSEWNGQPLTLQLVHINRQNHDNRIDNIILQCPNCYSQSGRNNIMFVNSCIRCNLNTPENQRLCLRCRNNIKINKEFPVLPSKKLLQQELIKNDFPFVQQKYGISKDEIIALINN